MSQRSGTTLLLLLFWAHETAFSVLLFSWGHVALGAFVALVAVAVAAYIIADAFSLASGAPFVAMESDRIPKLFALAALKPDEHLVDLGSGDGRIVIAAARAGATAEGWESNPYLWAYSAWKIARLGLHSRAKVHFGSYWNVPMRHADVVTLFLVTAHMPRMEAKLRKELRPGGRAVSFVFSFPDWKPEAVRDTSFLYRQP